MAHHLRKKLREPHRSALVATNCGCGVCVGISNTYAQQAALKSNALVAKLEAVDVGSALSPAVVQKLAEKMVKVPKSSPESKAEAVKAAEDITKVRHKTLFMAHHLTSTRSP